MAKLHFKYGAMNSGKSSTLLMIAYNYEKQGKVVFIAKPKVDTKGDDFVVSRLNNNEFSKKVDYLITNGEDNYSNIKLQIENVDVILVDEAQFLSKEAVNDLVKVVMEHNIPVICFGLRSDFQGNPFEGSSHLFAKAQDIEEIGIRSICECGSRATMNVRYLDDKPVFEGDIVAIDGEVGYRTMCLRCFEKLKIESINKE